MSKKKPIKKKVASRKPVKAVTRPAKPKGKGGAPVGNQFWKARSSHGRKPIFKSPEQLWTACSEYFDWVEANPLYEMKAFPYRGSVKKEKLPKMRAMTKGGLCIFLDINPETWENYKKNNDFLGVVTQVESIIREQKLTGAAADLLNPNIIARDLGLADKRENTGQQSQVIVYLPDNGRDKK